MLSNIYLHTVLDEWFETQIKPRLESEAFLIRFADDFVMGFESERDARRVLAVLSKRFERFGLKLHPEKTRLVDFRTPSRCPKEKPETFDFLGFTHYWGKSRRGWDTVRRKTAKDRRARTLKQIEHWCKTNRHLGMPAQHQALNRKLVGHYVYFGITGNFRELQAVYHQVHRIWFKWLRRRTRGTQGMTWPRFEDLLCTCFPLRPPRIYHSAMQ